MSENISVKMGVKLAASLNIGKNLSREGGGGGTWSGKGYRLWTECHGAVAVASKQC